MNTKKYVFTPLQLYSLVVGWVFINEGFVSWLHGEGEQTVIFILLALAVFWAFKSFDFKVVVN